MPHYCRPISGLLTSIFCAWKYNHWKIFFIHTAGPCFFHCCQPSSLVVWQVYLTYVFGSWLPFAETFTHWVQVRSSCPDVFCEKGVLRNFEKFTGKHLCQSLFFSKVAGVACKFFQKEALAQVFSCEFCEISKNTFFYRTPLVAASGKCKVMRSYQKTFGVIVVK